MAEITVFIAFRPAGEAHGHFEAPAGHAEALRAAVRRALRCRVELDAELFRRAAGAAGVPPEAVERARASLALAGGLTLVDRSPEAGPL